MGLFGKTKKERNPARDIQVRVNLLGFVRREYMNLSVELTVPEGAGFKMVLAALRDSGRIAKDVYRLAARMRPPVSLIINGDNVSRADRRKYAAAPDDAITIYTPLSGG